VDGLGAGACHENFNVTASPFCSDGSRQCGGGARVERLPEEIMTLTLELPASVLQQLENEARQLEITPQQLAVIKLQRRFETPASASELATAMSDAEFEELAHGVVRDYREVLERLA
jgi:hypothetical protein